MLNSVKQEPKTFTESYAFEDGFLHEFIIQLIVENVSLDPLPMSRQMF